jgi:hypothetical protein
MAKFYAWTTITTGTEKHPSERIPVGEEVSASDFADEEHGVDGKEVLRELCSIGAVRTQPYPIDKRDDGTFEYEGSPREHALQKAAEMEQGVYSDVDNTWRVPQLQANAEAALEASDYDPGDIAGLGEDEDAAEDQDNAEKQQGSRKALEGRGLTPGSAAKRTANNK